MLWIVYVTCTVQYNTSGWRWMPIVWKIDKTKINIKQDSYIASCQFSLSKTWVQTKHLVFWVKRAQTLERGSTSFLFMKLTFRKIILVYSSSAILNQNNPFGSILSLHGSYYLSQQIVKVIFYVRYFDKWQRRSNGDFVALFSD